MPVFADRTLKAPRGVVLPLVIALVAALLPVAVPAALLPAAESAVDVCSPLQNAVACENSKPGAPPSEWDIDGAGDSDIQGFSTEISVNAGQPIQFKVDTKAPSYTIAIYRTGWYQGLGARKIADVTPSAFRQVQPPCLTDVATELYDCGTWAVSATWQVPATAVSGVYVALLTRPDTGGRSHITFIVRADGSRSDIVFQTSDTSWQAYNSYGGSNFYQGTQNGRAYKISYNRPVATRGESAGRDFYFANEYPLVRFLEKNGYDVSYISGVDTDRNGAQLLNHKVFLSVGHDEYWSGPQRANVEAARDAGVNLQFLSGNEVYWRTRMEPSPVDGAAGRTITSYKETWSNAKVDPDTGWTGTWRDPRFAAQANGGGLPENGLTGTLYVSNYTDLPITVSEAEGKARLWRNTPLASLPAGGSAALAPHTVGYESNEDLDNGFRPPGLIRLSTTTGPTEQYLQDFGNTVAPGTTTHNITLYRAASGALVFSAGTVQWTWGLDQVHDGEGAPADPRMQQAQINLLADMGVQPSTRDTALAPAVASTDTVGPAVAVSSPAQGATIPHGTVVTVSGTASDTGGIVAGVEVSTDGGTRWHPARGKQNWSYTYIQKGLATATIKVRAVDDSANIGAVTTRDLRLTGPYTVFGQQVPDVPDAGDGGAYELGMALTPSVNGFITGVRFYKSTANTGTHQGSLWTPTGERLATATFTSETASGWQKVLFSRPVEVTAGQKYVVSYTAPNGHYASKDYQWASFGLTEPPLTVAGGFGAPPAGVYGIPGSFPSKSYVNGNYFVDAVFDTVDTSDLTASGHWPLDGSSSVPQATTVGAVFSKAVNASSVRLTLAAGGTAVEGTTAYDSATKKVTFTPASGLQLGTTYTATLSASDEAGKTLTGNGGTWSFTTVVSPPTAEGCPCSFFDDSVLPGIQEIRDGVPLALGIRFSSTVAGTVTGVRFYKSAGNTGTHTGTLFSASGQQLATVTFANESTSGWQTANFNHPVAIAANTEYIMAYKSTTGSYSATVNGFGSGLQSGNLRASSDAGAYSYSSEFPNARSSTSYLVDVVVQYPEQPFAAGAQTPLPDSSSVSLDTAVSAKLNKPATASSVTLTLTRPDSTEVPGTASYDSSTGRVEFTPSAPLEPSTKYTATLDATSTAGKPLSAGGTWTFTTVAPPRTPGACPCTLYQDSETPAVMEANDGLSLSLGVRFSSDSPGKITALRFYKAAGNTGTHTGALYTAGGQQLASVTFTDESSAGWQRAVFSQPVDITAGTEYVAAYHSPIGAYSATPGGLASATASGPLRTAPGAGAYTYSGGFPSNSSSASYLVDVEFVVSVPPLTVTGQAPAADATDFPLAARPSVTFSTAVQPGATFTLSAGGAAVAGTSALSEDSRTLTFTPAEPLPAATMLTAGVDKVVSRQGAELGPFSWQFSTSDPSGPRQSLFGSMLPAVQASGDTSSISLGTVFSVSTAGNATGIRFYKGAGNTGTHTGSLWSAAGERLADVTFTDETSTGWQTATFPSPVALTPGQNYVVSYVAPDGNYSYTGAFFKEPWSNGVLTAPGPNNGLYQYGTGDSVPTNSWNSTNYFVDILFDPATP